MPGGVVPLVVDHLSVRYGRKDAATDVSFTVNTGEVLGVLGPNGAGKTSTIKAIAGLVPKSGKALVLGHDMRADGMVVRPRFGMLMENQSLIESVTPSEYFELIASAREFAVGDINRLKSVVGLFHLDEYMGTPMGALSLGNRQKVSIIASLVHKPELLILDEPFSSLDLRSVVILENLIEELKRNGSGVLVSTHMVDLAEKFCDRIAILSNGKLAEIGTAEEIKVKMGSDSLSEAFLKATGLDKDILDAMKVFGDGEERQE